MSIRAYVYDQDGNYEFIRADSLPGGSKQLSPDRFEEHYDNLGLVRPPYDFEVLFNLFELDTWHRRSTIQKAADSTGMGWQIVKDPNFTGEANESDRDTLNDFFSNASPDCPLEDLLEAMWVDYDVLGNAALEIVRDGKGMPAELYHIPFKTVRIHRSQKAYAQVRGVTGLTNYRDLQWFVKFDLLDEAELPDNLPEEESSKFPFKMDEAGELLHFKSYDARSSFYGLPEAISAVQAMSANLAVSDYNIGRLASRGVPDYIMTLTGAQLDQETREQVAKFLSAAKKKDLRSGPKIFTFEVGQGEAHFEKITPDSEDANWLAYRRDNRDEILAAHGIPKYRIGIVETSSMGQNVAQEMSRIYSMSVVRPRRQRMEHLFNQYIIKRGFEINGWRIEFNELDIRNEQQEAETDFRRSAGVPVETINEIRRKRNLGPDLTGGDRVLMRVGHEIIQVAATPGSMPEGTGEFPFLPGVKRPSTSQEVPHLAGNPDIDQRGEELAGPELFPQDAPYTNVAHLRGKSVDGIADEDSDTDQQESK